nr:TadE/TadG family type IV pilus assembly protein [Serratia proteamaculans]
MQRIRRFGREQNGVATIEFSLTIILFLFMVLFVAEMSRMAYISSVIDLAISEAAKDAKNAPASAAGYNARFNARLTQRGGSLWGFLTNKDAVMMNITYSDSLAQMIATGGTAGNARNKPLARYRVNYQYRPMFLPFPNSWANTLFDREVIFVQEYERSKFMD